MYYILADMLSVLKSLIADKQGYYQNARAEEADPGKYIYTLTPCTEKLTPVIASSLHSSNYKL